jgi:hypothetical protein
VQISAPKKPGAMKCRIARCLRCEAEIREVKKFKAKGDFLFMLRGTVDCEGWRYFHRTKLLGKRKAAVKISLKEFI